VEYLLGPEKEGAGAEEGCTPPAGKKNAIHLRIPSEEQ